MKLLLALTYYHPHVSGLTIYVQRLAEGLAGRGHEVTVITARHETNLPEEEILNGVRVVRVSAPLRISKGVFMPSYPLIAARLLKACDAVVVNLPGTPGETLLVLLARTLLRRPTVAVYHCDLQLSGGRLSRWIDRAVFANNWLVGRLVHRFIAYTQDYAEHSPLLRRFSSKIRVIPPPVAVTPADPSEVRSFRSRYSLNGEKLIGFPARLATEKGVEVVLRALSRIREKLGPVRVLFAGPHKDVLGEEHYLKKLEPLLRAEGDTWIFLGVLSPHEMAVFYGACDLVVLPSLNSTESFGLVQVESMLSGTPVVASDLPGVRVPIQTTGMGVIALPGDVEAFADAVVKVIENRGLYCRERSFVLEQFSLERTLRDYEKLLLSLIEEQTRH
ncbi:MAG TPA: glycosyltransferase family 4 protein [Acidobacteriota bacterium]|nr:glycosyltransferase family 4 protein [Acidobacteriota bacterium]